MKLDRMVVAAAVANAFATSSAALAADMPQPVPAVPPSVSQSPAPQFEMLSGGDGSTRRSWDQYTQLTGALTGSLGESGARARGVFGFASYDYAPGGSNALFPGIDLGLDWIGGVNRIRSSEQNASILLGYEHVADRWALTGLIGADMQHAHLTQFDPTNLVQGTKWGFKVVAEFDSYPTDQTMFFAHGSYSTAFETGFVDVRPGWLVYDKFSFLGLTGKVFVGPQGAYYTDEHDQIPKAGAHVTFAEFGPFNLVVAGGYAHDRFNGPGVYGLLETSTRF